MVKDKKDVTISLVMIVKNEEKILRRCLENVKDVVDEYVVVDTGSTDNTKDIIAEYGTVYEIPFENFVKTKNDALELANGDYILFMDADEYFIQGKDLIRKYAEEDIDRLSCRIVEMDEGQADYMYHRARLWKNDGSWKFGGPNVHEVCMGNGKTIYDSHILVRHDHTHRTKESYEARWPLYLDLLFDYLEDHPNDPRALFYLARTYRDMKDYDKAITFFKRRLGVDDSYHDERWQATFDIALSYKMDGEFDQALKWCEKAIAYDPRRAEAITLKGMILYGRHEYKEATRCFELAMQLPIPDDVVLFIDPRAYFDIPAAFQVACLEKNKQYREALYLSKYLNDQRPWETKAVLNNIQLLHNRLRLKIFFTLGHTPEPVYGGMINDMGVGGVETTYMELPEHLAQLGHECFVFCRCDKEHVYNRVRYIPYQNLEFYADIRPDFVVTSRWFDPMYAFPQSKTIVWLQDAHYAEPQHPDAFQVCEGIVVSSPWHRDYTVERIGHNDRTKVINLGIRKNLFTRPCEKDPNKFIYSSNPDRGLVPLALMWPEMKKINPDAHLVVTYGWSGLKTWSSDPAWQLHVSSMQQSIMSEFSETGGVDFVGRLTKADLAQQMLESTLCLYPNTFPESFMITGLETQAAGVPMITTARAAIQTTLNNECNILIEGDPNSSEYKDAYIESFRELMYNREMLHYYADQCILHIVRGPYDWSDVADQWERYLWEF